MIPKLVKLRVVKALKENNLWRVDNLMYTSY
jgi:hypothetical protein